MNEHITFKDLLGITTIIFIILKIFKIIMWSWWWVLSPTLIPLLILIIYGVIKVLIWIYKEIS